MFTSMKETGDSLKTPASSPSNKTRSEASHFKRNRGTKNGGDRKSVAHRPKDVILPLKLRKPATKNFQARSGELYSFMALRCSI